MSFTYEDHLALVKPSDGDTSHGDELRQNFDVIGQVLSPKYSYFVSSEFSSANLANGAATDRRHFDTIQGAIDAIDAAATSSYANPHTIFLAPESFSENITVDASVTLAGLVPLNLLGQGGARYPTIRGVSTVADSVITVTPKAGESLALNLANVYLENAYSQQNATLITEPYAIDVRDTGDTGTTTYIGMTGVFGRCQTWGEDNLWQYGFKSRGRVTWSLMNSHFASWGYAGGNYNGGIQNFFDILGLTASGYNSLFYAHGCTFHHEYSKGGIPIPELFTYDGGVGGRITRSMYYHPNGSLYGKGSSGANTIKGVDQLLSTYGNLDGVEGVRF